MKAPRKGRRKSSQPKLNKEHLTTRSTTWCNQGINLKLPHESANRLSRYKATRCHEVSWEPTWSLNTFSRTCNRTNFSHWYAKHQYVTTIKSSWTIKAVEKLTLLGFHQDYLTDFIRHIILPKGAEWSTWRNKLQWPLVLPSPSKRPKFKREL